MVSFTVDPLHDTPEVLAQYAKQAGADNHNWMFLTGDRTALRTLTVDGFKMALDDTQEVNWNRSLTAHDSYLSINKDVFEAITTARTVMT